MRPFDKIREALRQTGLDWSIERGGRHTKFLLQSRVVAVMPTSRKCGESEAHRRRTLNAIKLIERTARSATEERASV